MFPMKNLARKELTINWKVQEKQQNITDGREQTMRNRDLYCAIC